jgi:hypothetical protein
LLAVGFLSSGRACRDVNEVFDAHLMLGERLADRAT